MDENYQTVGADMYGEPDMYREPDVYGGVDTGADTGVEMGAEAEPGAPDFGRDEFDNVFFDGEELDFREEREPDVPEGGQGEQKGDSEELGEEEQEQEQEQVYALEINGEQIDIPVSALAVAAQKGYAYEQAAQENQQLKAEMAVLGEYAQLAGMDLPGYLGTLRKNLEQAKIEQEAQRRDLPPEAARRVMEAERTAAELSRRQREQLERQRQEQARVQPFMELLQRYPELRDASKVPPEVTAQIQRGANPVIAYQDYLLTRQVQQAQVKERQAAVRNKTPGSAIGSGAGEDVDGAFAAFDSAFD